jgi:GH15 family glucan-1,4-alpha-glucosidase
MAPDRMGSGRAGGDDPAESELDLGVVGNSAVAALIDRRGRLVWWCLPRFDGDPVFCRLLAGAEETGFIDVDMPGLRPLKQAYLPNTPILVTELADAAGATVRITDFMPRFKQAERIFRPAMLIRRIEPTGGLVRLSVRVRPRFDLGATEPERTLGSNHVRFIGSAAALRVTTDMPVSYLAQETMFALTQPITLIFGPDEFFAASVPRVARDFEERTRDYWIEWTRYLAVPFEWQDAVIRAAIGLKLCAFEETGAIVAALTTSIPEAAGTQRNWDYRHCWLRDAYFTVHALNRLGATRTMEDYLRYITTVVAAVPEGALHPVYGIVPDHSLDEQVAPALAGFRGMGPVRIGNAAALQRQNDVYGSVVLAVAQMFFDRRLPHGGGESLLGLLERLGRRAVETAFEPDAGIWEFRGRAAIHTHSAAMCWAACARLCRIAEHLGFTERAAAWLDHANRLRATILARGWNDRLKTFTSAFEGEEIDASLLLLQEIGLVSAEDPRFRATLGAIEGALGRGDHLMRYVAPDDFGLPTTAFNVCSFWYVDALAAVGRRGEARERLEGLIASRTSLGYLSEDLVPATRQPWGNFPQTYSMVGLIISAMRLSRSWEEALWRGW